MDYQKITIIALVVVAVVSTAVAGAALAGVIGPVADTNESPTPNNTETPTTTEQQTVSEDAVNEQAQASLEGAQELKQSLSESEYSESRVFVQEDGTILVTRNSSAKDGMTLKSEMTDIAYQYSDVMAEHNETGSLTVHANGVTLMVSPDAAAAHGSGNLKDDAFEKTFHWQADNDE